MRAIVIPVDNSVSIHEVDVNLSGDFNILRSYPVDEKFLSTEQSVVLVAPFTSEDDSHFRDVRPLKNERASILFAPYESRDRLYLLGDVFVTGEDLTEEGVELVDLDHVVGAADIIELVERYEFR